MYHGIYKLIFNLNNKLKWIFINIYDSFKKYTHGGLNYGFVEYGNHRAAEIALQALNGRKVMDSVSYKIITILLILLWMVKVAK